MRETFHSYLNKLITHTKNPPTHLAAEQTREHKEAATNTPLEGKITTLLEKADHHAHALKEKSKKHRIPFVALALVAVFASLCTLSLLQIRPVALAHNRVCMN